LCSQKQDNCHGRSGGYRLGIDLPDSCSLDSFHELSFQVCVAVHRGGNMTFVVGYLPDCSGDVTGDDPALSYARLFIVMDDKGNFILLSLLLGGPRVLF
jgi:hypothetical protein